MRVAVFSNHKYDQNSLEEANHSFDHQLVFLNFRRREYVRSVRIDKTRGDRTVRCGVNLTSHVTYRAVSIVSSSSNARGGTVKCCPMKMIETGGSNPTSQPASPKFCVFGAGAIGGPIAVRLVQASATVSVIARGDTRAAIRKDGCA
jgi:hypothetical protein